VRLAAALRHSWPSPAIRCHCRTGAFGSSVGLRRLDLRRRTPIVRLVHHLPHLLEPPTRALTAVLEERRRGNNYAAPQAKLQLLPLHTTVPFGIHAPQLKHQHWTNTVQPSRKVEILGLAKNYQLLRKC